MKKIVLLFAITLLQFCAFAQLENEKAIRLIERNLSSTGLNENDLKNFSVSSTYFNNQSGTQMVYLQQNHLGIPIVNQLLVLAFRNEKLVSISGERYKISVKEPVAVPVITAQDAVMTAASSKKVVMPALPAGVSVSTNKLDFGKLGVSHENITAELVWLPLEGGEIRLAWQVYLVPTISSDYWLLHVDATDRSLLNEFNLTVYCTFEAHPDGEVCSSPHPVDIAPEKAEGVNLVNTVNYRVIPYPAESPNHPGGAHAIVTNPWTAAPGNATTLGWHNDGTTDYSITRGNNVWAQEDRDNNNNTMGLPATSSTGPDPLNFDFTPNFGMPPTTTTPPNQAFNITNLFYWNNIIHDITYLYGFDEPAANFQASNMGRGGSGSDYVIADAQDAGGTNNANFATPVDGQRPRMQMYLWSGNPQRDGDVDNGIVVHEYTHGISNRLTGGPSTASCLQNAEHMGEGWSDYISLMYTHDWANSNLNTGFSNPRGIGTYAVGQAPTGLGIRSQRYCTNFSINNKVYAASIPSSSHDRGEIWCATLWDMTWNIIQQVGTINPNLFNPAAGGGNTIALRLVIEGMKLQPCSPGFISGRDAILQADQILYGGQFECAIKEAFRRRGMGMNASQGSSGSVNDQVPDFNGGVTLTLTQGGMTQVPEGQQINYVNTITSTCDALTNFVLRDTLPANVTYVSGGTYDAATRVVSWVINQPSGSTQTYPFTVLVNNGSYFPPTDLINEPVATSSIPTGWSTTGSPINTAFTVSTLNSQSAPNSLYAENYTVAADQRLFTSSDASLPPGTAPRLSFAHKFNTEAGWDGGVVEISTNGGGAWNDIGGLMITNGYNGNIGNNPTNILANRVGFTGTINNFMTTTVNLAPYAGQNVRFRFRFGSDDNTTATTTPAGWWIDDIKLSVQPMVLMRSSLFNSSNVRVTYADTVTIIIQGASCSPVAIAQQPVYVEVCENGSATFTVTATGTTPITYQWQSAASCTGPWVNIPGETASSLTIPNITSANSSTVYRVIIDNGCPSQVISDCAGVTLSTAPTISIQPVDTEVCPGASATFTAGANGAGLSYQWQVSTNGGVTFSNVPGGTATSLTIPSVNPSQHGTVYQLVVTGCGGASVTSSPSGLNVTAAATIDDEPQDVSTCAGTQAVFTINAEGAGLNYQWQVSTNNGATYNNLPGEINPTLTLDNVTVSQSGNMYRVLINGTCTSGLTSNSALLTVNTSADIAVHPQDVAACTGEQAEFSVQATGTTITYQWQVSINGSTFVNIQDGSLYSGTTTANMTVLNVLPTMNGYRYRVIVSGVPCGGVVSNEVTLTANSKPGVVLVAAEYSNLTPSVPSALYTTVSPEGVYTYQWYQNGILMPGVTTSSMPVNVDLFGEYYVIATGSNGCSALSNKVNVSDSLSSSIFIYPNPNDGRFQVRYHSIAAGESYIISVYDSKGARVYSRKYSGSGIYNRMDVDLQNAAAGVYLIDLSTDKGRRLATSKVIIQ